MLLFQRLCLCVLFGCYCGANASAASELEEKFADLVAKGLMSQAKLDMLKKQLLEDDSSKETETAPEAVPEPKQESSTSRPSERSTPTKAAEPSKEQDTPRKVEVPDVDAPKAAEDAKPARKSRDRPKSMEESMREFGIDPDAINKLGEKREPTDVNAFVAAAMQASAAKETARHRDMEILEDQEDAEKEKELSDDEVHVESEGEPNSDAAALPDLGKVLPGSIQDKLKGVFAKFGDKMDPDASALLSALLPGSGLGDDAEDEEADGSTEDLAGLLADARHRERVSGMNAELEELDKQRKERDERMEKEAEERKVEMARRQAKRDEDHKVFEAEMAEKEKQREKDRAEFEEGRKRHKEYMDKMEERKKASEKRREDNEKRREQQQDRMAEALKMAGAEIASLKAQAKKGAVHDEI